MTNRSGCSLYFMLRYSKGGFAGLVSDLLLKLHANVTSAYLIVMSE